MTGSDGATQTISVDPTQVDSAREEAKEEQNATDNPSVMVASVDTDPDETYTADDDRFEVVNGQLQMKPGAIFVAGEGDTVEVVVTGSDGATQTINVDPTQVDTAREEAKEEQNATDNPSVMVASVDTAPNETYTADDERFEVVNGQLQMKPGAIFVAGEGDTVEVVVTGSDGATQTINVDPTQVDTAREEAKEEQAATDNPAVMVASVDTVPDETYTADDERFEVVNGQLQMKPGATFVAGEGDTVSVTVTGSDGASSNHQRRSNPS